MPQLTNLLSEQHFSSVISLVTDSDLHRHILKHALLDAGYDAVQLFSSMQLKSALSQANTKITDAWLVDTSSIDEEVIDCILQHSDEPLLANDEVPSAVDDAKFRRWQKNLSIKLQSMLLHDDNIEQQKPVEANRNAVVFEKVWVLAASLGGPEAVSRFLGQLAPDLAVAMVYAQHTEQQADITLSSILQRKNHYAIEYASSRHALKSGKVTVVPVQQQLRFFDHGEVLVVDEPWYGSFQPAIDQVIAELARIYRERLGVIIFSGLCDDGAVGCRVAKACGATLWAQSPESCIGLDMPQAAIDTGFISKQGSPEELADALTDLMRKGVAGVTS